MTQTPEENSSDGRFGHWGFEIRACFGFRIFGFFPARRDSRTNRGNHEPDQKHTAVRAVPWDLLNLFA
jgi:hypothetical protein